MNRSTFNTEWLQMCGRIANLTFFFIILMFIVLNTYLHICILSIKELPKTPQKPIQLCKTSEQSHNYMLTSITLHLWGTHVDEK